MVDFTARAGCVLRIPPLLMGLVFIAAGTSVPDALSSISVARAGEGDMAVANVLGSNIFNILLGLALPWFLKALIDGQPFALSEDEPILSSVLVLIAFLVYFLWLVARAGWTLNREIGKLLLTGQLAVIVYSALTFCHRGAVLGRWVTNLRPECRSSARSLTRPANQAE